MVNRPFLKEQIGKVIEQIATEYGPVRFNEEERYRLVFKQGSKEVELCWPYEIGEVFFAFVDGETTYEDWCECFEEEDLDEFRDYLGLVISRFLDGKTRLRTKGLFWKSYHLEFCDGSQWQYILAP